MKLALLLCCLLFAGCSTTPRPSVSFADPFRALPQNQGVTIDPTGILDSFLGDSVVGVNACSRVDSAGWKDKNYCVMFKLTWDW